MCIVIPTSTGSPAKKQPNTKNATNQVEPINWEGVHQKDCDLYCDLLCKKNAFKKKKMSQLLLMMYTSLQTTIYR